MNNATKGEQMDRQWTKLLTDDDEWVVRTALANVAADLRRVSDEEIATGEATPTVSRGPAVRALRSAAGRYEQTLKRIEDA